MALCPFAVQRPLARVNTQPKMSRYDLFIPHTAGGNSLGGLDAQFHVDGYTGLEAHFGIGADGTTYQWVDTARTADAQLDGNDRAISVETADRGGGFAAWTGSDVPAWTDAQVAAIIRLGIWVCDTHKIPKVMAPDSKPTSRGIAGHRQGVDSSPAGQPGYRVAGGEHWSTAVGKVCPGDRRFAQLRSVIVPGIASGGDELSAAEVAQIIDAIQANGIHGTTPSLRLDPATGKPYYPPRDVQAGTYLATLDRNVANLLAALTPDAIANAVIAKLPPSSGGAAPTAAEIATAVRLELATHLGGTS